MLCGLCFDFGFDFGFVVAGERTFVFGMCVQSSYS